MPLCAFRLGSLQPCSARALMLSMVIMALPRTAGAQPASPRRPAAARLEASMIGLVNGRRYRG